MLRTFPFSFLAIIFTGRKKKKKTRDAEERRVKKRGNLTEAMNRGWSTMRGKRGGKERGKGILVERKKKRGGREKKWIRLSTEPSQVCEGEGRERKVKKPR